MDPTTRSSLPAAAVPLIRPLFGVYTGLGFRDILQARPAQEALNSRFRGANLGTLAFFNFVFGPGRQALKDDAQTTRPRL